MPRSTTVWAAALVLASFSGSGPLLTTAEAMPAPGPQETQNRPRYYFPRHIKRQIVTNTTGPAAPTPQLTSSDSSSSSSLESRKFDLTSALSQLFSESKMDSSSSSSNSIFDTTSEPDRPTTVTSTREIIMTPVPIPAPDRSEPFPGTGNLSPSPAPVVSTPEEQLPSSAPQSTPQKPDSQTPESSPQPAPVQSSSAAGNLLNPILGPTGLLPGVIIPASSSSSLVASSSVAPSSTVAEASTQPTASPSSAAGGLLPSLLAPIIGPTGGSVTPLIPLPTPAAPVSSGQPAASTGSAPEVVVPPTSAPASTPQSSAPAGSSFQGPFIVPGSTGGAIPSSVVQPTSSQGLVGGLLSSVLDPVIGSTGAPVPSSVIQPTTSQGLVGGLLSSVLDPVIGSTGAPIPSSVVQPTSSQGVVGGLLSSVLDPVVGSTGLLPTSGLLQPTPAPASPSSQLPSSVQASSGGIVVGITTALGTGAPVLSASSPVLSSGAIPTSEAVASSGLLNLPSVLSSLVSEVSGVLPSGSAGPTAPISPSPTAAPSAAPSGVLPPLVSSLVSDVSSLLSGVPGSVLPSIVSSLVSELPTGTASAPLPPASSLASSIASDISSGLISSGVLPTGISSLLPSGVLPTGSSSVIPSGVLPTGSSSLIPSGVLPTASSGLLPTGSGTVSTSSETASLSLPIPSETLIPTTSAISSGSTPPAVSQSSSGILPSGSGISGSGVSSAPAVTSAPVQSSSVPASEGPASSSAAIVPPSSSNATLSETPTFVLPTSAYETASASATQSQVVTSKPAPVQSQKPTGTDSATSMLVGTSIIRESTSNATPTPTSSGIPSSLPKMIAPPEGVPTEYPANSFMGQVCFKWPLNYPFVSANDGGSQIFHYLPRAIADGLNITEAEVRNIGLRPLDTTAYQGFITTLALFTIPSDLQGKLQAQLRNPADAFWHNKDSTVNDLTSLINTACPLPAGKLPGDNSSPNQAGGGGPSTSDNGGDGDGGALGGDANASRPINASAAGIATGAIVGAIAYGAAMFFVARRYRNKRVAHQRSSSVPSTGSRMTYGSIPGGAAAWMHGARNGRITPGSRGSHGSASSQGPSVRTQQISAPVMAENSLGWN
ncbi:hypothetical protein HBI56_147080 [Parastagonospora nodorum]|nr:hypothetical protein HBH51_044670 [Parastagonospora nodorum]KAH3983313.1 hypothetical protein HBH52_072260 [Parastagonospora nodorum]KAH3995678.1 hypothetical protein HBI10_167940 [Parastagonospora nodorum]KAH4015716.1 hypothetical protein HBI13_157530 [Parastagonospora nodorum]KAH4045732.1 hypothetical protein HBH49_194630 [Parastagonospora nodorum]